MSRRRAVGFAFLALAVAIAPAVMTRANADWRTASRSPVGIAPQPAEHPEALVQVYGARTAGWRGTFGVHTWVAVKPARAADYTVYEVIGWKLRWDDTAVSIRSRAPARGVIMGLEAERAKIQGQVFNLGTDNGNYSKDDIVRLVLKRLPQTIVEYKDLTFGGDMRDITVSICKD